MEKPMEAPLATKTERLLAALADTVFTGFFIIAIGFPKKDPPAPFVLFCIMGAGGVIITQFFFLATRAQTFGKQILGIRIVDHVSGEKANWVKALVVRVWLNGLIDRIIKVYSLLEVLLIFRKDRRCVHDHLAGTKVVSLREKPISLRPLKFLTVAALIASGWLAAHIGFQYVTAKDVDFEAKLYGEGFVPATDIIALPEGIEGRLNVSYPLAGKGEDKKVKFEMEFFRPNAASEYEIRLERIEIFGNDKPLEAKPVKHVPPLPEFTLPPLYRRALQPGLDDLSSDLVSSGGVVTMEAGRPLRSKSVRWDLEIPTFPDKLEVRYRLIVKRGEEKVVEGVHTHMLSKRAIHVSRDKVFQSRMQSLKSFWRFGWRAGLQDWVYRTMYRIVGVAAPLFDKKA